MGGCELDTCGPEQEPVGDTCEHGKEREGYVFFWVVPRRQNYICRRFGTLYLFHPMKMEQIVFRNVGIYNSDAGELPKIKHNIFRTRRKFEIKNEKVL